MARPRSSGSARTRPRSTPPRSGPGRCRSTAAELLEPTVQAEPVAADLATRVELGQTFDSLVTPATAGLYRAAYPVAPASATDDPAEARFRSVCAGRATDGVALYQAAKTAQGAGQALPATPVLDAASAAAAAPAVAAFVTWVEWTWVAVAPASRRPGTQPGSTTPPRCRPGA